MTVPKGMMGLKSLLGLSLGAALVLCATASANAMPDQMTLLNDQAYGPPGQFYLYNRLQQKVFNFPAERKVRLCVSGPGDGIGEGRTEPMQYHANGRSGIVRPGVCKTITTKHLALSPARAVRPNWEVDGTVKKIG